MNGFRKLLGLAFVTMLLALLGTIACAPPAGLQNADSTQPEQHKVPFRDTDGKSSSPTDSSAAPDNALKPETDLPFHDSKGLDSQNLDSQNVDPSSLPVGTLLTVRTRDPITAESPGANGTFEAVVDQPVIIEGNPLVPIGATVSVRVESAGASNLKRNRGFVRLTLESIQLAGSSVPVQTSSLFVRGHARPTGDSQSPAVRLEKGRLLVFRLTEPVHLDH